MSSLVLAKKRFMSIECDGDPALWRLLGELYETTDAEDYRRRIHAKTQFARPGLIT